MPRESAEAVEPDDAAVAGHRVGDDRQRGAACHPELESQTGALDLAQRETQSVVRMPENRRLRHVLEHECRAFPRGLDVLGVGEVPASAEFQVVETAGQRPEPVGDLVELTVRPVERGHRVGVQLGPLLLRAGTLGPTTSATARFSFCRAATFSRSSVPMHAP